jgi:hypothetical protein
MQNLNIRSGERKTKEEKQINFYQEARVDTEVSGQTQSQAFPVGERSRNNIMNGGRQLTLMTVCSDVMDNSADLILDYIKENSQASQQDEEDEYLTFQLCEGEEMNNEMANFIGIHMLNDGYLDGEEPADKPDQDGGLTYQCP